MNDQPKKPDPNEGRLSARSAEAVEAQRKVEEVAGILQPTMDALRELGYDPRLIADGKDGVIRMTLEVHTITHT